MNKRTIGLLTALVISILATGLSVMPASAQSSYSEIVMEANSERVLYENRSDEIMPMASTTKILTALVVIEDCSLDEIYQIPAEACGIEGSSV